MYPPPFPPRTAEPLTFFSCLNQWGAVRTQDAFGRAVAQKQERSGSGDVHSYGETIIIH